MKYKNGIFFIEKLSADKLANKFGTPAYIYSERKIKENIDKFKKKFSIIKPLIRFSVKSNANKESNKATVLSENPTQIPPPRTSRREKGS